MSATKERYRLRERREREREKRNITTMIGQKEAREVKKGLLTLLSLLFRYRRKNVA